MIDDDQIDACGFRMFDLGEIARTMVMQDHPLGGAYRIGGNKREVMAQLGNAVTPPATRLKLERLAEVLGGGFTFADLFCGAGGSSIGATLAGGELRLGLNHWARAIETHADNFPDADHDCADVSALTTARIRSYPDTDVLLASPECTNHSLAKGAQRRKPQASSLWEDGPAGDDEQDRSRATMWDVVRFAEQKLLKGHPYKAIVVENVTDAFRWGADDNGQLFAAWRQAIESLGYKSEIVWLNSMFALPTPQSRDRMYVVYWLKTIKAPNLRVEPISWCPACEKIVEGLQSWKRPERPLHKADGSPVGARYGSQYLYTCPICNGIALPGAFPAASAIDWLLPTPLIGGRTKPLAVNTRERIRRGLERLASEPFAIRLLQGGSPKPLTLPLVTLTARLDMAMVLPVSGNTFERTPGNRARDAVLTPMKTICATEEVPALVLPNRANNVPKDASTEPSPPILTGGTIALIYTVFPADQHPVRTVAAEGGHHGVVIANYGPGGDRLRKGESQSAGGWARCAEELPVGSITATDGHALVVPYQSEAHSPNEPARTIRTRDRLALIIPKA